MTGENIVIRDAYGAALKELGEQSEKTMGLEANVASFTRSGISGKASPERYPNMGISELGMVFMSAGFARGGLVPCVNMLTVFLTTRGADPIQNLTAYGKLNVKLYGVYCGPSDSYDGASHQAITDLAFMRVIPSMAVIIAAGAAETKKAVSAIAGHQGPVYLRLSRTAAPVFYPEDMKFETGRDITVRGGGNVAIITTGTILHKAPATTEPLETKGARARVVDMHTIKPIDEELVIEYARETGAIIAVEEHFVCGGLGSTVAETLAEHMPVPVIRIRATGFAESGDYKQFLVKYGYGPKPIVEKCERVTKHKQVQKR